MSLRLNDVPMTNPAKPIMPINAFLMIINAFAYPVLLYQFAHVSNRAGNKIPSVDNANAPINDINISKFGIRTAITTEHAPKTNKQKENNNNIKHRLIYFFSNITTFSTLFYLHVKNTIDVRSMYSQSVFLFTSLTFRSQYWFHEMSMAT